MKKPVDDMLLLDVLEQLVERSEAEWNQAEKKARECQEQLSHARALLEAEHIRIGPAARHRGRYSGVPLRDAATEILRDALGVQMTAAAIHEELLANGGSLEGSSPGRAMHAALLGVSEIEKVNGMYRWRISSQPAKDGRENAQQG